MCRFDIQQVASDLDVDPDMVFGRLYYHLEQKHGYSRPDGGIVHFFALQIGTNERHRVQFPYLASVLAHLKDEEAKSQATRKLAIIASCISMLNLIWQARALLPLAHVP